MTASGDPGLTSHPLAERVAARFNLIEENLNAVDALHARVDALHARAAGTPWHAPLRKAGLLRESRAALREAQALLDHNDTLLSASYADLASGR